MNHSLHVTGRPYARVGPKSGHRRPPRHRPRELTWIAVLLALAGLSAQCAEATLTVAAESSRLVLTRSQLLARPDLQVITVTDSIYQGRLTRFKAIPMESLLQALLIPPQAAIECDAVDGFSSILDRARLLNTDPKASKAFLAVEDPRHPWPALDGTTASAGPFYIVWTNPRASAIGREEWPYQVAEIRILPDPRRQFPHLYPAADAPASVLRGLRSFQKNCFACHTMNGDGAAAIGPDLNLPMNPTDYFTAEALTRYIRDPGQVRNWPAMRMPGFSAAAISDAELADLIDYLRHMSARRRHT